MAQSQIELNELDSLYLRALRLSKDLLRSSNYTYFEIDSNTKRIKDLPIPPKFKFIPIYELVQLNSKKNRGIDFYKIHHKVISTDTIDVSFYAFTAFSKGEGYFYGVKGGGTMGYHTDIRFARRKDNSTWEVIYNRFGFSE